MNFLVRNFLRGLVITIPIVLTAYVLYQLFVRIDRLVGLPYPGAGFVIVITAMTLIGVVASNIVGRTLLRLAEALFTRAPFVKIVYSSIKDLIEAFVGDKRRFTRPVLVSLSPLDAKAVGFVTREDLRLLGVEGHVAVYFPQSYNFAGNLLFVPTAQVSSLNIESSQAMAFVVSGGVSGFPEAEGKVVTNFPR